jgi:hypothetical protein
VSERLSEAQADLIAAAIELAEAAIDVAPMLPKQFNGQQVQARARFKFALTSWRVLRNAALRGKHSKLRKGTK